MGINLDLSDFAYVVHVLLLVSSQFSEILVLGPGSGLELPVHKQRDKQPCEKFTSITKKL